ncbi:DUF1801 domain-containing protein [Melittangium boletus]|uniref:YdhG-like domain-containing protein n=1 Tax=Melittangium boletus DSM 14713 TaxID=1294270 RepID=A0A250IM51_9BACT|nr:DUF1801 domain-containing protein [Melittangium boletus]ATB32829.1 hypothetical protein MEBOL_006318 [Melittangium boletus DSM 14713]
MTNRNKAVDAFMKTLEHPRKAEVERIRALILGLDKDIQERIKWNAPSFGPGQEDRVTFRLAPKGKLQLIFHRGAKAKDAAGFAFEDPSGLLQWAAKDRAVLELGEAEAVKPQVLGELVRRWMAATREG